MNKAEYNQNMINYLSVTHGKCMNLVVAHDCYGMDNAYPVHDEVRSLIGRELTFSALEAQAERAHALRFNHVLDRAARAELLKRKIQARKTGFTES